MGAPVAPGPLRCGALVTGGSGSVSDCPGVRGDPYLRRVAALWSVGPSRRPVLADGRYTGGAAQRVIQARWNTLADFCLVLIG